MLNRGGNRYDQVLPPDVGQPRVLRDCFETHGLSADWRRHHYWHNRHALQDVIRPEYWGRDVIGNIHPGDVISCQLGPLGERQFIELGVLSVSATAVEVSIISRGAESRDLGNVRSRKETPIAAAHFKAKGTAAA